MSDAILKEIKEAIDNIKYGSVEIIIHDSKVVEIQRKEKTRFNLKSDADRSTGSPNSKSEGEKK